MKPPLHYIVYLFCEMGQYLIIVFKPGMCLVSSTTFVQMSVCVCVCLSVCLSVYMHVWMCVCPQAIKVKMSTV